MEEKLDIYYLRPGNERRDRCDSCNGNKFTQKGNTTYGICVKCKTHNYNIFFPKEKCTICRARTYWTYDINDIWYCSEHKNRIPFNLMSVTSKSSFKEILNGEYTNKWDIKKIYEHEEGRGRKVLLLEKFKKLIF